MTAVELDRVEVIRWVLDGRLSQIKAAVQLDLSSRQVRRLCCEYEDSGPTGLASRKRGSPSKQRLPEKIRVVPLCPFAKSVIDRTPEFQDVLQTQQ